MVGGVMVPPEGGVPVRRVESPTFSSIKKENHELLLVGTQTLADTLSISLEWVRQLSEQGIVAKHSRGKFDLLASVKGFLAYRDEKDSPDASDERFKSARADLYEERARFSKIEADLRAGKSFDADCIREVMKAMVFSSRARMLQLPTTCAAQVAEISDPNACFNVLKSAVYECLNELSEFDGTRVHQIYLDGSGQESAPAQLDSDL